MGLLPCIRRGSERWWLPRSVAATDAIGDLILAGGRGGAPTGSLHPALRDRVVRVLENDPPLLIYAALTCGTDQIEPPQLVDQLAKQVTGRFAAGDAFLGAPTITARIEQRWAKLYDHYRSLPLERWLDDAALWLEVAGPKVPRMWIQQWPRVVARSDGATPPPQLGNDQMLQQLARTVQRQAALESSFDKRLQRSKLAAMKQLAYGLSHEINNPLANISTRAQQLQRGEKDAGRAATLQRIIDQVYRAHEMIADLMFYANPTVAIRSRSDLNPLLHNVVESFREEADRQTIRLEVRTPETATEAVVDDKMISEAIRALVRNAMDAVGCQGTVVVSLVRDAGQLRIHVADSGPGLSELARQHAFDPYFSGREAGRGLGLGLCRAYRICHLHHAEITLAGGPIGCVATITLRDFTAT